MFPFQKNKPKMVKKKFFCPMIPSKLKKAKKQAFQAFYLFVLAFFKFWWYDWKNKRFLDIVQASFVKETQLILGIF